MAKIVVLDDQLDICSYIQQRLAEDGHEVRTSQLGDEAIDFVYLFKPDVLITDWRLGDDYNGLEVAEAFLFANKNVKTIMITGYPICEVKKHPSSANIYRTLPKPFSLEELARVVEQALSETHTPGFSPN